MADIIMFRGGTPDFKAYHCEGDTQDYMAPVDAPHQPDTPPFDSHADGAYEQGYLNLAYPLIPNLAETQAHQVMQRQLKRVKAVGDVMHLCWIPTRAFLDSIYFEVTRTDKLLDGVKLTPVASRMYWDFNDETYKFARVAEFTAELTAAGITSFPAGTPQDGDVIYGMARLSLKTDALPSTFAHNIVKADNQGNLCVPYDNKFGAIVLGYEVSAGSAEAIQSIWKSNLAIYMSAKLIAFDCPSQIG